MRMAPKVYNSNQPKEDYTKLMADSGGGAGTQLCAMPSGQAECFDSAGDIPCGDEAAPPHGEYLSGQLPAAKRHGTHPRRP